MRMSDVLKKSELTLWQNYCDKKIECDRLTEENAKLREVLEKLVNPDNCKKDIIHIISNAESLLNQLKDQNNDK